MGATHSQENEQLTVTAGIFARKGSVGVPGKNMRVVGGQSLLERAIAHAASCPEVERVVVSTDGEAMADVARAAGAEVPWLRPKNLSGPDAREWDAWRHLLLWLQETGDLPSRLLVVPCTAPLRNVADLSRCLTASREPGVDVVITVSSARRNPWFNMVIVSDAGRARLVLEPDRRIHRRQDAPEVYDVATVAFVVDPAFVLTASSIYDGNVVAVEVSSSTAVDIDTIDDLRYRVCSRIGWNS